jgi:hypothetical protein
VQRRGWLGSRMWGLHYSLKILSSIEKKYWSFVIYIGAVCKDKLDDSIPKKTIIAFLQTMGGFWQIEIRFDRRNALSEFGQRTENHVCENPALRAKGEAMTKEKRKNTRLAIPSNADIKHGGKSSGAESENVSGAFVTAVEKVQNDDDGCQLLPRPHQRKSKSGQDDGRGDGSGVWKDLLGWDVVQRYRPMACCPAATSITGYLTGYWGLLGLPYC